MKPWWERYPGRLEREIQDLEEDGISCVVDKEARAGGTIVLNLTFISGELTGYKMRVIFPPLYPLNPFELEAEGLSLHHHQNPFAKNLCLLDKTEENWKPSDTVAALIRTQLPHVLKAGNLPERYDGEAQRGEPITMFMTFASNSIVLIDSEWSIKQTANRGILKIGCYANPANSIFRGAVLEVRGDDRACLAEAALVIRARFSKAEQIVIGRWVRFNSPPISNNPHKIWEQAIAIDKSLARPRASSKPSDPEIIGILLSEETGWREMGDGWIFLFRIRVGAPFQLVRSGRAGRVDLQERNPALKNLSNKKVAIFGLGCLGAPSTLEFAKCGVGQLRILDHDIVEPGTIVRWPFGLLSAGADKCGTLYNVIRHNYPYTEIDAYNCRIGIASWPPAASQSLKELDILHDMINGADLVYDATASPMINNMLAMLCSEYKATYILVAGTPGMWGGRIVRIRPGHTGCLHCYYQALADEQIPLPATDESNGEVAPKGCSSATFTGTYFDASEIAMGGVRMAISTLMENTLGGYPPTPWDVAIINLRDTAGNIIPPQWLSYRLPKHPRCSCNDSR